MTQSNRKFTYQHPDVLVEKIENGDNRNLPVDVKITLSEMIEKLDCSALDLTEADNGKEFTEGVHFTIKKDYLAGRYAVPIKQESEDELWDIETQREHIGEISMILNKHYSCNEALGDIMMYIYNNTLPIKRKS